MSARECDGHSASARSFTVVFILVAAMALSPHPQSDDLAGFLEFEPRQALEQGGFIGITDVA